VAVTGLFLVGMSMSPATALEWTDLVPQSGGVCMVTANGVGRAALTFTVPVVDKGDWKVDVDMMLANSGDSGVGVCVGLDPLATLIEADDWGPMIDTLLRRVSVGTAVMNSGELWDAGIYWKLKLTEWKF